MPERRLGGAALRVAHFTVTTEFLPPIRSAFDSGFASSVFHVVPSTTNLYS